MKKFKIPDTGNLLRLDDDGKYHCLTIDPETGEISNRTYEAEQWQMGVTQFLTAVTNSILDLGLNGLIFEDEETGEDINLSIEDRTVEAERYKKDFDRICRLANNREKLPANSQSYDVGAYWILRGLYICFWQNSITKETATAEKRNIWSRYIGDRKQADKIAKMYEDYSNHIRLAADLPSKILKGIGNESWQDLLVMAMELYAHMTGDVVTFEQVKKRVERADNEYAV